LAKTLTKSKQIANNRTKRIFDILTVKNKLNELYRLSSFL
jgi:hypothetical protein